MVYTARGFGNGRNKLPTRSNWTHSVAVTKKKKKKVSENSGATKSSSSILTRKGTNAFNINNFKRKQKTKSRVRWNSSVKEKPFRIPAIYLS